MEIEIVAMASDINAIKAPLEKKQSSFLECFLSWGKERVKLH